MGAVLFFTGIDQHRLSSVLTTATESGERLAQVTLANDQRLLTQYFAQYPGRVSRGRSPRLVDA